MVKKCRYCNSDKLLLLTDEIRDSEDCTILRCDSCGLIFLDTKEDFVNDLNKFYNEDYPVDNTLIAGERISPSEQFNIKVKSQQQIIPTIIPLLNQSFEILEIGCGVGSLLYLLKDHVRSCTGLEINREQADFARAKLGSDIYTTSIKEIPKDQKYDVIILISVLEHLEDPFQILKDLTCFLKPDGFLFIEIPNCNEALLNYLPEDSITKFRKFFYHKAHLYYFTEFFFGKLLNDCGYQHKVSSRHDYTLINYLHWWFLGMRQESMQTAQCQIGLFDDEEDPFKKEINDIFKVADNSFREVMQKYKRGYILTYIVKLAG